MPNRYAAFDRVLVLALLLTIWGCIPFVLLILWYAVQGRICPAVF
jgi:hypothetical protein